ncbi:MAG: glycoside hydrolase family 32 protein [Verrucomicrobia bacterium]|nr:glycoside hydrolase family 32 protein [Verrucomicrobiota bacterium]
MRKRLVSDPHRPLFHLTAPSNWINDPNGAFLWKDRYHLFYQYNPNGAFWGTIHWGHAFSSDLVHWQDCQIALSPSRDGPDRDGCWSGCVVDDQGVPTALYTGLEPQTVCLATGDDDLEQWKKLEKPIIAGPPSELRLTGFPSLTGHASSDFRDPYVWREEEKWFLIIGAGMRDKGGTALLYESKDLRDWRYLHPILSGVVGENCNMWECPVLLRTGGRCALFVCPHPEAKHVYWLAGQWRDYRIREQRRGKLDLGTHVYATQCLYDPARDRHLVWNWVKEGRPVRSQLSAGWSGALSIPKECGLGSNDELLIRPAKELSHLRRTGQSIKEQILTPFSSNPFEDFGDDCLEVESELSFSEPTICELCVRVSHDHTECTTITYNSAKELLTVDASRSSSDPDVDKAVVSGPLKPENGIVRFHVFLDRSVLEIFLTNKACITQRLYPQRSDSLGLIFLVRVGSARVHRLSAWKMASIWADH